MQKSKSGAIPDLFCTYSRGSGPAVNWSPTLTAHMCSDVKKYSPSLSSMPAKIRTRKSRLTAVDAAEVAEGVVTDRIGRR